MSRVNHQESFAAFNVKISAWHISLTHFDHFRCDGRPMARWGDTNDRIGQAVDKSLEECAVVGPVGGSRRGLTVGSLVSPLSTAEETVETVDHRP